MDMQAIFAEMGVAIHEVVKEGDNEVLDYKDFAEMESDWLDDNYPEIAHPDGASCPRAFRRWMCES